MSSINTWSDRFFKIILIMAFFFILVLLTIVSCVGPAPSYEFSIYDAFPWYFWVFFLSAVVCGQAVILGSAITRSEKNYWLFGLFAILVSNALLLILPMIREYYIYGDADVLTHVGYMNDILRTSSIGGNHYPIDHLLGVTIHLLSGLSLPVIIHIIPPLFSFFFILSMYFVGKAIFLNKYERMILVLLASILMFGNWNVNFTPNSQAIFLVPLILYLAFKIYYGVNTNKYYILLLLISSLIVFYHPLVTIMVILILCLMQVMEYFLERYLNRSLKKVNFTYIIFFMVALFSIWSSYLIMATDLMLPIIGRLFGNENIESEFQKNFGIVSKVSIDPLYLIKLIFNVYGQWILLGILSLLSIGLILKSIKNQKTDSKFYQGFFVLGYVMCLILSIAMLFVNGSFDFGRVYSFATLFSLLLIPIGISLFLYNNPNNLSSARKIITFLGVILIIFWVTYFSTFNLYYSPTIKYANQQVPKSDYLGMSTFFSMRDDSLPILELGVSSFRFFDAIYGASAERVNIDAIEEKAVPPDHFGYQNATIFGEFLNNSKFVILNDKGRGFYQHMYPEFKNNWRFLPGDFEQLKFNNKIQQIYSNKNLEIFRVS
jgi:hypothetical protein